MSGTETAASPVPRFAHLRVSSTFSLRDGTITPERLAVAAAKTGMSHVALTDRDGLSGAVRLVRAAADAGVIPLLGVDLAIDPGADLSQDARIRTPAAGARWRERPLPRVTLLALDATGFGDLCRVTTRAHANDRAAPHLRIDDLALACASQRVVVLLGADSPVGVALASGRPTAAAAELDRWRERFGPARTVLGVRDHRVAPGGRRHGGPADPDEPGDDARISRTLELAARSGARAIAVNDVRHERPDDVVVADVLRCIRLGVPLSERHLGRTTSAAWFTDPATQARRFRERPDLLVAAADLAEQFEPSVRVGELSAPRLTGLDTPSAVRALAERARAGIERRLSDVSESARATAHERLERELAAIDAAGFHDLFLAVADVVDDVRAASILVACRGSAAGSLVCFALGISDVDPLLHGLAFERFMNPYREELPDIDLDVESHRREDVYDLVIARYGEERVACVGMFETFQARSAVRDVGKALGLPAEEIEHVARRLPHLRARDVRRALDRLPELAGSRLDAGRLGMLLDLVERIDGMPRHLAMHPCGILLGDEGLLARTPIQRSAHGYPTSQFDKDDVAALGFLKLDVLGVRMLSAMRHCLDLVNGVPGGGRADSVATRTADGNVPGWREGPFRLDLIAHDEPATYDLIRSTHSVGMFQIESPGQRELLGRLQPTCFGDLIAEISLFRPGPMRADMVTPYVARRHGDEPVSTPHPALEPVLAETFGVIIYHEQVMGVLSALTGCDASTADLLRRRLGDEVGRRFVHRQVRDRARERGFPPDVIEEVFADVASFASFGFCKAHAAAFAVPTERSAFLKAHLFPEFMAGLITHDPGMYPRRMIVEECRLFGVPVIGPDVIGSGWGADVVALTTADADVRLGLTAAREAKADGREVTALLPAGWSWPAGSDRPLPPTGRDAGQRRAPNGEFDTASRWAVRLGLDGVAGLSGAEIDRVLAGGRPTDLGDLRDRIGVERTGALALAEAGALDRLARVGAPSGPRDRRALRLAVEETWSSRRPRRAVAQQTSLLMFEDAPSDLPPQPLSARVRDELVSTGVELSAHVVSFYAPLLEHLGVIGANALREIPTGERVRVAGVRVALQSPPQRSGSRVMFLTLDDRTGQVQVTFFSRALPDCAFIVSRARLVVAEGVVARRGQRGATVIGRRAWDLTRLWAAWQDGGLDLALRERGTPAPHLVGDGSRSTMATHAASGRTLRSADGGRASR